MNNNLEVAKKFFLKLFKEEYTAAGSDEQFIQTIATQAAYFACSRPQAAIAEMKDELLRTDRLKLSSMR